MGIELLKLGVRESRVQIEPLGMMSDKLRSNKSFSSKNSKVSKSLVGGGKIIRISFVENFSNSYSLLSLPLRIYTPISS